MRSPARTSAARGKAFTYLRRVGRFRKGGEGTIARSYGGLFSEVGLKSLGDRTCGEFERLVLAIGAIRAAQ